MKKVRVKVEVPRNSRVKYEYDKTNDVIIVDRILKPIYPFNYGFVPETLWEDGDPLDAIIIGTFNLHPGVEAHVKPLALIEMYDNGESDYKLVTSIEDEKFTDYWEVIKGFLRTYKSGVEVHGFTENKKEIERALEESRQAFFDNRK